MVAKSFFKKPSAEERQKMLRENMLVSPINNTSPEYNRSSEEIKSVQEAQQAQLISVNLMQLRPFDGNPRKTKNPKFEEIKESIRMRGLDFAPNITKRPGEDFYIIADGGNTRLQALNELWEETHDPKFWSIRCLFKPWKNEGDLSCLIGHLAENDLRGDLSFVERALAIADIKVMYEKGEFGEQKLSHRQLSERLKADGYTISHPILFRMEQCLTYLYPAIPNVLLAGMGKPQIEKLLTLRSNAISFFKSHNKTENDLNTLWQAVLSPMDNDPSAFSLTVVQDELIGAMVTELDHAVTYEDIYFDISLDEHKQRRQENEFQSSLQNNDGEAITAQVIISDSPSPLVSENVPKSVKTDLIKTDKKVTPAIADISDEVEEAIDNSDSVIPDISTNMSDSSATEIKDTTENTNSRHIFDQFGMTPGMSLREQQEKRAEHNGLTFANTGHQPVTDIWQIFPAFDSFKRLAQEANGLAYDILRGAGLNPKTLITYPRAEEDITDFTFSIEPLPTEAVGNPLSESLYELVAMLASDNHHEMLSWTVSETLLAGNTTESAGISDILLVKIFRLIRIVRRMREHLQHKNN